MTSEDLSPKYITPALPPKALDDIRSWNGRGKYYRAFTRPLKQVDPLPNGMKYKGCKNCVDADFVMVSFVRAGPFVRVTNHKKGEALIWFSGNGRVGKGWYIVAQTLSYDCPLCRPHGERLVDSTELLADLGDDRFPWQNHTDH